ncbi:GNAT family N-acetyltransferase [Salmonella enterica subsp. enterica serovar Heidelberg]|nr:GNAT family N-acetyltransferase [Salmonella enterica subsp. enterica serovar Heidelberg]ELH2353452.1 GNAT family N-acetyltransferase [Salmonella enterica]
MKIITIVGPDTANGRKYSTDILALYNELDKSEIESYRKETGINVRFTPAKSLAERFRGRLLAVVENERLYGFAQYRISETEGVTMMSLTSLVVSSDARGKGYGSALMAAVKAAAKKKNCDVVHLSVNAANTVAKSLYDKSGFKVGAYQMYWRA